MLGLPQSTGVKRPLPKAQLYKWFDWKPSQRDSFDSVVANIDFIHWISPKTVPAITVGTDVKEIFVIEVTLKSRDFNMKPIELLAQSVPQRVAYLLRYEQEARLAVYHTKLFVSAPQDIDTINISLSGLNLDAVWETIVSSIGSFFVEQENSLTEQIKIDTDRAKIEKQIATLEKQMYASKQPRRKRELFEEIKKLKFRL